jgi:hypothetical protein
MLKRSWLGHQSALVVAPRATVFLGALAENGHWASVDMLHSWVGWKLMNNASVEVQYLSIQLDLLMKSIEQANPTMG